MYEVQVRRCRYLFSIFQFGTWSICNNGNVIGKVKNGQTVTVGIEGPMGLVHVEAAATRSNAVLVREDEGDVLISVSTWLHGPLMLFTLFLLPWVANAIGIHKETKQNPVAHQKT